MSVTTRYHISRPQIIREQFDEEIVIVDLDSGSYYSLSGSGSDVWNALEDGASEAEIVAYLQEIYEANAAEIAASINTLLAELQREELIAVQSGQSDSGRSELPAKDVSRQPWQAPVLQKFTDMQALLLLDPIHQVDSAGWPQAKAE